MYKNVQTNILTLLMPHKKLQQLSNLGVNHNKQIPNIIYFVACCGEQLAQLSNPQCQSYLFHTIKNASEIISI